MFVNKSCLYCDRAKVIAGEEVETFLFLYDVLWLESTTLLIIRSPLMSVLDMILLFVLHTSGPIYGGHYAVGWDGAFCFP